MSQPERRFAVADLFAEMRRRRVVRFALGYCAAAFVLLQLGEIVLPAFGLGDTGLRILVVLVVLGFPPGVALAWIFELTREGIRRTRGGPGQGMLPRVVFLVFTIGIAGGLAGWLSAMGAFAPGQPAEVVALEVYDPSEPVTSIAVLPLDDFSPDGGQTYFASALQEELAAQLSQLEWLRVASRTSVVQYEGTTKSAPVIGRELGVDALVEGSVTRSGDQVRITLQIIHAASDSHIRTLQFDREVTDVLALQSEVAMELAAEVPGQQDEPAGLTQVAQVAGSSNPDAQDAYLRGRYEYGHGTLEGYRRAVGYFEEAFQNDSSFASALAGLAGARFLADIEDGALDAEEVEKAGDEAIRALALDSTSAEAREVLQFFERNLPPQAFALQPSVPGRASIGPGFPGPLAELDTAWAHDHDGDRPWSGGGRGPPHPGDGAEQRGAPGFRGAPARRERAARLGHRSAGGGGGRASGCKRGVGNAGAHAGYCRTCPGCGGDGGPVERCRRAGCPGRRGRRRTRTRHGVGRRPGGLLVLAARTAAREAGRGAARAEHLAGRGEPRRGRP